MELRARLHPLTEEGRARLLEILSPAPAPTSDRYPVSVEDPALSRVLDAGEAAGGYWVSGEAVLDAGELASVGHFEAVCRLVAPETDADRERNTATVRATAERDAGGFAPIRLARGFVLSRLRLRPNQVASIGDWTGEYVVGPALARALETAGCTGHVLLPVGDPRTGRERPDCHQIFGEAVLPPALVDCSVERIVSRFPEERGLRHLGCLSYRPGQLSGRPDLDRTAEPWAGSWGWPSWVVSARVVALFRASRLRGWAFRPVLVEGTDLHGQYLARWERLRSLVAGTASSRLDGGRW